MKLRPYGEDNPAPIPLVGSFFGLINTPSGQTDLTKFLVLKARNAGCLLSRETSTRLGMLHIAASTTIPNTQLCTVNTSTFYRSSQQCLVARSGNSKFTNSSWTLTQLYNQSYKIPVPHPYTTAPRWKPSCNSLRIKVSPLVIVDKPNGDVTETVR